MTISAPAATVTVERTIQATPAQIYRSFTVREELNNWFCDNAFVQLQVNGAYLFVWNQEQFMATGIFKKLEENKSLELTWRSTWKGDSEAADSIFSVTIAEAGNGSTATLTHSDISAEGVEGYEWQWNKRMDDLKQYLETGALPNIVNRVIIGIFPAPVPAKRAEELGLEEGNGTLVTGLVPNYGAEKAGIQVDDVILAMDGNPVTQQAPMNVLVQGRKPGDEVEVTFYRGGEKVTKTMALSGYPVPPMPTSLAALADEVAPQHDQLLNQLSELFAGVSEEAAGKRPAEGEWSAKHVLCHLIYSERWLHEAIGGRITGGQPQHWSGNHDGRLQPMLDNYPTVNDLLQLFRREMDETLAIWRNFPQDAESGNKNVVWGEAFGHSGWVQHTQLHVNQIRAALEAAQ